jgi:GTP-binding protein Era
MIAEVAKVPRVRGVGLETVNDTLNGTRAPHRSGFVAIVGRPNVGKSTLLNRVLGQKIAMVTPRPQTTRSRILGIKTLPDAQLVFIDTPGLHQPRSLINRRMVQVAERAVQDADVVLWLVDAVDGITSADRDLAARFGADPRPVVVVVNKIDRLGKRALLPLLAALHALLPGRDVVPVSALSGENLDELLAHLIRILPVGPCYYDADTVTDQTERMLVQEAVREQVLLQTRDEVPYRVAVTVDQFEDKPTVAVIAATIHVERASQKGIVIGQRGARIKAIGTAARRELEQLLGRRVYLELFVRVQEEWTTRESLLKEFGL